MTTIVEFYAENTRILKLVRIRPDGNVVILGGENESGKTTVLDDIELIFAGGKSRKMPAVPIRTGQSSGKTSVKLSNGLTLTREWTGAGTQLAVRDADGRKLPGGPQTIADRFYDAVAFDPLEFADKMDDKKQAEVLRKLVGLDFTELDARHASLHADREESWRDLKRAEGQLAGMPPAPEGTPDAEVSIAELLSEQGKATKENLANQKIRDAANAAVEDAARAKVALDEAREKFEKAQKEHAASVAKMKAAKAEAEALQDVDTTEVLTKLGTAEATNRLVRAKKDRAAKAAEVEKLQSYRANLTAEMASIDAEKDARLAAVDWPIDGLGFNSDGVTYKGLPFSQASKAARYKVSIAIGAKLHPELQVMLIRDASLLDKKSMALLAQLADEQDQQLWIERVGDQDPGAIILEDGEVKAVTKKPLNPARRVKVVKDGKEIA